MAKNRRFGLDSAVLFGDSGKEPLIILYLIVRKSPPVFAYANLAFMFALVDPRLIESGRFIFQFGSLDVANFTFVVRKSAASRIEEKEGMDDLSVLFDIDGVIPLAESIPRAFTK